AASSLRGSCLDKVNALDGFEAYILSGCHLLLGVATPAGEKIAPGDDRKLVAADLVEADGSCPAVVVDKAHGCRLPFADTATAPFDCRIDNVVAVAENIGFDDKVLPHDGFRREATAIDLGRNALDGDTCLGQLPQHRIGGIKVGIGFRSVFSGNCCSRHGGPRLAS